jgi:hypothetical protein
VRTAVKAFLLVQVDDNGRAESHFRFALEGKKLEADFRSDDIFSDESLAGYSLRLHVRAEDIELRQNCLSSKWEELVDLVAKNTVLVSKDASIEEAGFEFRSAFSAAREQDPDLGAAIRWSLQARKPTGLRIVLQGLPALATSIKRSAELSAEDGPTVCLDSARVLFQQEEAHLAGGPTPILFARDPAAATESLSAYPDNIREGNKINKLLEITSFPPPPELPRFPKRGGGGGLKLKETSNHTQKFLPID